MSLKKRDPRSGATDAGQKCTDFLAVNSNNEQAPSKIGLLRANEAAEQLAIGLRKLWEITNTGELKSIKIGRAVRYHPQDLADFIAKHRSKGGAR